MDFGGKILVGAAATVALGLVGHILSGESFISDLEKQAQTELAARGLNDAMVTLGRAPLSRSAILDGDLADDAKQEAVNVVAAIPGISGASWLGQEQVKPEASEQSGTTAAKSDVDAKSPNVSTVSTKLSRQEKSAFAPAALMYRLIPTRFSTRWQRLSSLATGCR